MKRYIIFAGVNGAGKSTLYNTIKNIKLMPRVNPDEILRGIGDWKDVANTIEAGKIAVARIKEYFLKNLSKIIPMCDLVSLYDNTERLRRFAIYKNGELCLLSENKPKWFQNIMEIE